MTTPYQMAQALQVTIAQSAVQAAALTAALAPTPPPTGSPAIGYFTDSQVLADAETVGKTLGVPPTIWLCYLADTSQSGSRDGSFPVVPPPYDGVHNVMVGIGGTDQASHVKACQYVATTLKGLGYPAPIVRQLWEPQGDWMLWGQGGSLKWSPGTFIAIYEAGSAAIMAIIPGADICLSLNGSPTNNWQSLLPALGTFTSVGFDGYDGNGNGFPTQIGTVMGPWAASIGKGFHLCEVGMNFNNPTDDPTYVTATYQAAVAQKARSFCFFNDGASGLVESNLTTIQYPKSAAAFLAAVG